jgi:hypothetical protein
MKLKYVSDTSFVEYTPDALYSVSHIVLNLYSKKFRLCQSEYLKWEPPNGRQNKDPV